MWTATKSQLRSTFWKIGWLSISKCRRCKVEDTREMITRTHYYRPGQGAKKKSVGSLTLPDLSGDEFAFIDWIESYGAALASVTTGLIIYYVLHRHIYVLSVNSQFTALFGAVVSVCAISVGFLGTVAAVLFAIDSRRVVRRLRKINTYQQFMGYVVKAAKERSSDRIRHICQSGAGRFRPLLLERLIGVRHGCSSDPTRLM